MRFEAACRWATYEQIASGPRPEPPPKWVSRVHKIEGFSEWWNLKIGISKRAVAARIARQAVGQDGEEDEY